MKMHKTITDDACGNAGDYRNDGDGGSCGGTGHR